MSKNKKLVKEKELLEEKVESVNQIKQESSDIQVWQTFLNFFFN